MHFFFNTYLVNYATLDRFLTLFWIKLEKNFLKYVLKYILELSKTEEKLYSIGYETDLRKHLKMLST